MFLGDFNVLSQQKKIVHCYLDGKSGGRGKGLWEGEGGGGGDRSAT